ncbi:MAG: hypothetical protein Q8941_19465 [Bacteroidota bacterium]|nr:hypothetical protein [Bacteroidota bacterium]
MKKVILFAALLVSIVAGAAVKPSEVSEKVLQAFKETFTQAKDVVWHEYEDVYQANFKQDEIQIRAEYDHDGALIKTIRYYGEKQLLPNVLARLKKKYGTKEIFGVTETTSDSEVSFLITLRDDKDYFVVKSDVYGNLDLTEKFHRADK